MKNILTTTLIVLVLSYVIPGIVVTSLLSVIIFSILLGLVSGTLGRLLKFAGCALNILTFGFFNLAINAFMIQLVDNMLDGIHIENFWIAALLAIVISLFSTHNQNQDLKNERL
ncbi:phage holin family protein [Facklamia miroungae]|uniref:Putative membrane protein n=1 Tax=Facklamia miroungae TaxID=120956 RepID=A0A1G7PU53_9LACT|nr:phage holin family protein [Facklamia miroungae]NKZ28829.1 phage holin family protein [Facklamia miroungae]SDF89755.1 putative membrane protein [Facklamia miroungae]